MLKLYGVRINLDSIESKLLQQGFNCVCIGNDKELKVLTKDKNYSAQIKNYLVNKLNIGKHMFNMYLIKKIPRNLSGKVVYSQIQEDNSVKIR